MAVIDASVAVRWFVHGPGSERSAPWQERADLLAPDLICAEVANALWQYVRQGVLATEEAGAIIERLPDAFLSLRSGSVLAPNALQLAAHLGHPVYDCFYLALAHIERCPLVTLDRKLARLAQQIGITPELLL